MKTKATLMGYREKCRVGIVSTKRRMKIHKSYHGLGVHRAL